MDGYAVDCGELLHAEGELRELAQSFADSTSLKYTIAPREVGSAELAQALDAFHTQSRHTADELCAVAVTAADRLHDTATSYARGDQASADAIAVGG